MNDDRIKQLQNAFIKASELRSKLGALRIRNEDLEALDVVIEETRLTLEFNKMRRAEKEALN